MGGRVRDDQRGAGARGRVPEAPFVDVGEIHHDPEFIAGPHQFPPGVAQPRARVGGVGKPEGDARGKRVGPTPDDSQGTQPGLVKDLQGIQLGIDGLGPLKVKHDGKGAGLEAGIQFSDGAHHPDLAGGGGFQPEEAGHPLEGHLPGTDRIEGGGQGEVVAGPLGVEFRPGFRAITRPGGDVNGKKPPAEAARLRTGQIDVALIAAGEKTAPAAFFGKIKHLQGVVVSVENRQGDRLRHGVLLVMNHSRRST